MIYWLSKSWAFLSGFESPLYRMGGAFFTALILTLAIGPFVIRWLKKKQKEGQPIRECLNLS